MCFFVCEREGEMGRGEVVARSVRFDRVVLLEALPNVRG